MEKHLIEKLEINYGYVNRIIHFSNVDGPGNRMAIFLQGCNMRCLYCHNPETQNICISCGECIQKCPVEAIKMNDRLVSWNQLSCINCDQCISQCTHFSSPKVMKLTATDILNEALKVKPFIRGITFSGGECTIQKEFLYSCVKLLKENGFHVMIDSNGLFDINDSYINKIIQLADSFMLDIKFFNNNVHQYFTGVSNSIILKNLVTLLKLNKIFEVRTVVFEHEKVNFMDEIEQIIKIIMGNNITYKVIKYRHYGVSKIYKKLLNEPSDKLILNIERMFKINHEINYIIR